MAVKKKKTKGKKATSYRTVGSIWSREIKTGEGKKTIRNFQVDNADPDDEYHKGTLLWQDKETGNLFKVKGMNLFKADKGPDNLLYKMSLDLQNEYHVEEVE